MLETEEPYILQNLGFPNTYTFSKNFAEQVLTKRCGNLRMAVIRPSSILACCREPFPGWLDQIGPSAAVLLPMGLGMADFFYIAKKPFEIASVPCDIVANAIIVTSMVAARFEKPRL